MALSSRLEGAESKDWELRLLAADAWMVSRSFAAGGSVNRTLRGEESTPADLLDVSAELLGLSCVGSLLLRLRLLVLLCEHGWFRLVISGKKSALEEKVLEEDALASDGMPDDGTVAIGLIGWLIKKVLVSTMRKRRYF